MGQRCGLWTIKDLVIGSDELQLCQNVEDILSSEALLPLKCLFQNFSANGQHFCFELCQAGRAAKGYAHTAHSGQSIGSHVGSQMETNSWMPWSLDSSFFLESSLSTGVFDEGHLGKNMCSAKLPQCTLLVPGELLRCNRDERWEMNWDGGLHTHDPTCFH